jgi:cell division initiation protein
MDASATQLTDIKFNEAKRGYDPVEVDNFLEKLGDAVVKLQEKVREANRRADDAERRAIEAHRVSSEAEKRALDAEARVAAGGGDSGEDELAETLKKTLLLAQRTADETVKEAKADAEQLVAEARKRATREIEDATRTAAAKLASVEEEIRAKRATETAELRTQVDKLEEIRVQLVADVEALEGHTTALRDRMRTEATALLELVADHEKKPAPTRPALSVPPVDLRDPKPASKPGVSSSASAASAPASSRPGPSGPTSIRSASGGPADASKPGSSRPTGTPAPATAEARPVPHVPDSARPRTGGLEPAGPRPTGAPRATSEPASEASDSGPATQPVSVIEKNPDWDPDDGFLDELRKAVDDESPLGPPDADADAAMQAFFSAPDDNLLKRPRFGRRR